MIEKERVVGLPIRIKEATDILIEAYGENLLTEREYDRRLRVVQAAETLGDVDDGIWDLPQNFLDKLTKFENYNHNSFGALDYYSSYLKDLVTNELDDGELISWVGQISKKRAFNKKLPLFFFGIPFTAFALFWMISVGTMLNKSFGNFVNYFALFGLPFLIIGIFMLLSPFIASLIAKKSIYIITDRRAIIFNKTIFSNNVKSYYPKDLSNIETNQKGEDEGDIIFSSETRRGSERSYEVPIGFWGVKNFNDGKKLLKELKRK